MAQVAQRIEFLIVAQPGESAGFEQSVLLGSRLSPHAGRPPPNALAEEFSSLAALQGAFATGVKTSEGLIELFLIHRTTP
jgi:hypothetical protein